MLLEGAPFVISDPLAGITTSEFGSVGEGGARLSTTMNWRRIEITSGWDLDTGNTRVCNTDIVWTVKMMKGHVVGLACCFTYTKLNLAALIMCI